MKKGAFLKVAWLHLILAVLAGFLLGGIFFGGLWWTVNKLAANTSPAVLLIMSFLVRTAVLLAGFYFLLEAGWQYLLAAMFGFLAARTVVTFKYRPEEKRQRA